MNEASADDLFRELRALLARGTLRLELDLARLDHIDSPVAVEADSNIWVYGSIAVCAIIFWQGGTYPGVAAVAVSLALYFTVARRYVRRRLIRRVHERALGDGETWRRLWRFGGVTLVQEGPGADGSEDGDGRCAAPQGNWMALVRRHAADSGG
jgi:hypothetical protein